MTALKGPESRRRAFELARVREKPIAQVAKDLGIAASGLRRWSAQAESRQSAPALSDTWLPCAFPLAAACNGWLLGFAGMPALRCDSYVHPEAPMEHGADPLAARRSRGP